MKLIDEKVIEEACLNHCNTFSISPNPYSFEAGVSFAEQQLQPFIVEFAEWCLDSKYPYNKDGIWTKHEDLMKQLLEEFIEFKNKQK